MPRSVLVTGGSGYFGTVLAELARARGDTVRIFDLNPTTVAGADFVMGDVRDRAAIRAACEGVDILFHNVAQVPLAKDRALFDEVNVGGTANVLVAARAAGVAKVVHTSSSAVFGIPEHNPVTENSPCRPLEAYGRAKLRAEILCHDAIASGLDVTIVRPRTVLGHGRLGVMALLFEFVADGAPVFVLGGGHNRYQLVHATDLADACLRAGDRAGPSVYNVGALEFGTMRETLQALVDHARTGSRLRSLPVAPARIAMRSLASLDLVPFAPYHWLLYSESLYFDVTKARTELSWEPRHSNASMIIESYEWFLAHRRESHGAGRSHHQSPVRPGLLPRVEGAAVIDDVAVESPVDPIDPPPARRPRPATGLLAGLIVVLSFPLVVALVKLRHPHWYPLLDMAQTEIRVRDVTTGHPPLIGLAGRIGPFGPDGGSHPGPLSFYALWPVWKLFGGSSYGMFASTVVLDIVAIGLALWMALRRGGRAVLIAMAAVLAVLMRAYGAYLLTLPWNPYLPVLWWFVFVLALWSVVADDLAMLPVAVFAGSLCAQTHISYLGLIGGLVLLAIVVIVRAVLTRRDPAARRALWKWTGISVALGAILWTPPVIDQVAHSPGNLDVIRDYFSHPPDSPIGFGRGIGVLVSQLNPWDLFTRILVHDGGGLEITGSRVPGALLLIVFGASVLAAWRMRHRLLLSLDLVLVIALGLGLVSSARIFGTVWFYLLLWAWGIAALMLFAIGWTAVELGRRRDPAKAAKFASAGAYALAAVALVVSIVFAAQASNVTVQTPRLNETLGAVVGPTADALAQREARGERGPYLVTWLPDAQAIGSAGYGLLNELDRRGFDVRAGDVFRPGATRYHVIGSRHPTLEVHLATGPDIANWQRDSRFTEVTAFDPRSEAERAQFDELHGQVVGDLRRAGLDRLVPQVDDNLFMLAIVPKVPAGTRTMVTRMLDLSMPMAVFIGPPGKD